MAQLFPNHPNLRGGFAPLQMECDVHDLIIEGEVPKQLNGTFYRNGPNRAIRTSRRVPHVWWGRHGPRLKCRRRARKLPQPLGTHSAL